MIPCVGQALGYYCGLNWAIGIGRATLPVVGASGAVEALLALGGSRACGAVEACCWYALVDGRGLGRAVGVGGTRLSDPAARAIEVVFTLGSRARAIEPGHSKAGR